MMFQGGGSQTGMAGNAISGASMTGNAMAQSGMPGSGNATGTNAVPAAPPQTDRKDLN
jgi:hypothetical protein